MPWRRRKTGSSRQRGNPFYVGEDPKVAARQRAIAQGRFAAPSHAKRLKDIGLQDIQKWTTDSFKKRLIESVVDMAGDSAEVRIWLRANWERLYKEFLDSGKSFEDWFNIQAFF